MLDTVIYLEENNLLEKLKKEQISLLGYTKDQVKEIITILEGKNNVPLKKGYWK